MGLVPGEDPLEKGMATHSTILAWRIPWTEEPSGLRSMRSQSAMTEQAHTLINVASILSKALPPTDPP